MIDHKVGRKHGQREQQHDDQDADDATGKDDLDEPFARRRFVLDQGDQKRQRWR